MGAHDDGEQFQVEPREQWRSWLATNHRRTDGVWLVTWKKHTGRPAPTYGEGVEEALCFGWVDSLPRRLDDDRTMLWYAPRKRGSGWSRPNKERIERLEAAGLMTDAGRAVIEAAKSDGSWTRLDDVEDERISEDVYQQKRYDLCSTCRKAYLKNPLGRVALHELGFSQN